MQPLTGGLDDQPPARVEERDPGFGLQVGVLLPRCGERTLDDDVCRGKGCVDVALDDALVEQHVVAIGVHALRAGKQRVARVADDRQVLVFDAHEGRAVARRAIRRRDDERDAVAVVTNDVVAEHRLIALDQPVPVVGNVARREDRDDAGKRACGAGVDAANAGVRAAGEDGREPQHLGVNQVRGIAGRTGHFAQGVVARVRGSDDLHAPTSTAALSALWPAASAIASTIFT